MVTSYPMELQVVDQSAFACFGIVVAGEVVRTHVERRRHGRAGHARLITMRVWATAMAAFPPPILPNRRCTPAELRADVGAGATCGPGALR